MEKNRKDFFGLVFELGDDKMIFCVFFLVFRFDDLELF